MTFSEQIAKMRKNKNMTQEALAQQLGVTNQAVSKWEGDQCCPDITLLPKLADIFGVSIDELFGRTPSAESILPSLPGGDDSTLRVVLFQGGHRLMEQELCKDVTIHWQGKVANLRSDFSVSCEDVSGYVQAGGAVNCGDVEGPVSAGGNVNCGDVGGPVKAGGNVSCGDIAGDLIAGGKITCGDISGNVTTVRKDRRGDEDDYLLPDRDITASIIASMRKDMVPDME